MIFLFCNKNTLFTFAILEITYGDQDSLLKVTENHPFYVVNREEYVSAKDLVEGDLLLSPQLKMQEHTGMRLRTNFQMLSVKKIEVFYGEFSVYNLEAEVDHNYLVGNPPVLVHNCNPSSSSHASRGSETCEPVPIVDPPIEPLYLLEKRILGDIGVCLSKGLNEKQRMGDIGECVAKSLITTGAGTLSSFVTPVIQHTGGFGGSLTRSGHQHSAKGKDRVGEPTKRFTKEQEALVEMAKKDKRTGITKKDMDTNY